MRGDKDSEKSSDLLEATQHTQLRAHPTVLLPVCHGGRVPGTVLFYLLARWTDDNKRLLSACGVLGPKLDVLWWPSHVLLTA